MSRSAKPVITQDKRIKNHLNKRRSNIKQSGMYSKTGICLVMNKVYLEAVHPCCTVSHHWVKKKKKKQVIMEYKQTLKWFSRLETILGFVRRNNVAERIKDKGTISQKHRLSLVLDYTDVSVKNLHTKKSFLSRIRLLFLSGKQPQSPVQTAPKVLYKSLRLSNNLYCLKTLFYGTCCFLYWHKLGKYKSLGTYLIMQN